MPLLPILFALLLPVVLVVAIPFSLVQRYRIGASRRRARPWLATINLLLMLFSTAFFLWSASLTNFWIRNAFNYALTGVAAGAVLGLIGLGITRWENSGRALHYTPNRWLVLFLTVAVAARVIASFWRGWHAWRTASGTTDWLQQSGVAASIGVGALVLSYYLVYSIGVLRKTKRASTR